MPSAPIERTWFARATAGVPPPGLLLISIVSIQLGAAVAVSLFESLGPLATTSLRLGFSAVLLLVAARAQLRRVAGVARSVVPLLLLFGCGLGAMNMAFYGSISRIPLGLAVAIEFVGPLAVATLTSRRLPQFLWIGLAVVGLALLTPDIGGQLDPLGVALALGAGVCWAGFVVISPRIDRVMGETGLALAMPVAAVFTLPFMVAAGGIPRLDAPLLLGALAVAVFSTAFPLSLEFQALRRMTARAYGVTVTLEPVVAVLVGAVVLSQALPANALAAIACVTVAAVGVTLSDRRAEGADPAGRSSPPLPG
jgi:inner membrane transporter RhtA